MLLYTEMILIFGFFVYTKQNIKKFSLLILLFVYLKVQAHPLIIQCEDVNDIGSIINLRGKYFFFIY